MEPRKIAFTLDFPCKAYVKRYIEHNFGSPGDLRRDKELNTLFRSRLKKPLFHTDAKLTGGYYQSVVKLMISTDDFYRFGWELSKTDINDINNVLESRVKAMARTYISINNSLGFALSAVIDNFQEKFDFPEDVWSKESITKDFQRNGTRERIEMESFSKKINAIFLKNMHKRSVISTIGLSTYENKVLNTSNTPENGVDAVGNKDTNNTDNKQNENTLF